MREKYDSSDVPRTICPSAEAIDATASIAEPILRNLSITAAYAQLSRAFAEWLPGGANWCTFAVWASRQAGCTIRKEDFARVVAERLRERMDRRPGLRELRRLTGVSGTLLPAIAGEVSQGLPGIDRASDAVARGNLKVFEEIGREFARFLATARDDPASTGRFIAGLRTGPPPEGQELLRWAFGNYALARVTSDRTARAQLLLLANVQIGVHEQTRLQPEIAEGMDAALLDVADTRRRILDRLDEVVAVGLLPHVHTGIGRDLLNAAADDLAQELRPIVRIIATGRLMSIGLPGDRTLSLGSDIRRAFPDALASLSHSELVALLAPYAAAADTARDSGATDWSHFPERMDFIATFFRAYQDDETLFGLPFPAPQLAEIAAGRVPDTV